MLIITRHTGTSLYIGDHITIVITQIKGQQVRIGIEAPKEMTILRDELLPADANACRCPSDSRDDIRTDDN